ncbi:MAG: NYN domain-containing protein [Patescibacteria group bacterium]|nr:NYN domain-containing protein [Patescibacteria group bacterium]
MTGRTVIIVDNPNLFATAKDLGVKPNLTGFFKFFINLLDGKVEIFFCYSSKKSKDIENDKFSGFEYFISNRLWGTLSDKKVLFKEFQIFKKDVDSLINIRIAQLLIWRLEEENELLEEKVKRLRKIVKLQKKEIQNKEFSEEDKEELDKPNDRRETTLERIIIVSGDSIFVELLEKAKKLGLEVWVVAGKTSCANSLQKLANKIYFLEDLFEDSKLILKEN